MLLKITKCMIVQCATFSESLNLRNIDTSVSDIRIRIRFPFESTFCISGSGCKLTILPDNGYSTDSAHYAYETTVFLNGKYTNTKYISKIWPESNKPRFSIKPPEPQIKQENPRSSEKSPVVATLMVTVCATKSVYVAHFAFLHKDLISQNAQTCAELVLTDWSTPHSAVIPQSDVNKSQLGTKTHLW